MATVQYWQELYEGPNCPWIEGRPNPFALKLSDGDAQRLVATQTVMDWVIQVCRDIFESPQDEAVQRLSSVFGYPTEVSQLMYQSWQAQNEQDRFPALARYDLSYDWVSGSLHVLELQGHAAGWLYEAVDRQANWAGTLPDTTSGAPMINLMEDLVNLLSQRGITESNPLWIITPGGLEAEDDYFLMDALNANGSWARIATFEEIRFGHDGCTLMVGDENLTGTVMLNSLYFRVISSERERGLDFSSSPLLALFTSPQVTMLDPLWVMLLENKALLALLWEKHGHETDLLLETVSLPSNTIPQLLQMPCILKLREECNSFGVEVFEHGLPQGHTHDEPAIVQSLVTLPRVGEWYVVTHAWFVGGKFSQPSFIAQQEPVSSSGAMVPCLLEV